MNDRTGTATCPAFRNMLGNLRRKVGQLPMESRATSGERLGNLWRIYRITLIMIDL